MVVNSSRKCGRVFHKAGGLKCFQILILLLISLAKLTVMIIIITVKYQTHLASKKIAIYILKR